MRTTTAFRLKCLRQGSPSLHDQLPYVPMRSFSRMNAQRFIHSEASPRRLAASKATIQRNARPDRPGESTIRHDGATTTLNISVLVQMLAALQLLGLILKLTCINCEWWIVLMPIWLPIFLSAILLLVVGHQSAFMPSTLRRRHLRTRSSYSGLR